jgi:hypothetical protein
VSSIRRTDSVTAIPWTRFGRRLAYQMSGAVSFALGAATMAPVRHVPMSIAAFDGLLIAGLAVAALLDLLRLLLHVLLRNTPLARMALRYSAPLLTDLAVFLAGRRGPALRDEWRAHLAGESGHDPVTPQKVKEARGFVLAAVRYRIGDAAATAWTPADAILRSWVLSNMFVLIPSSVAAVIILHHDGAVGLLVSAESIAAIGGTLYGLVRVGRWWRDVKTPEPKARRAKE